MLVSALCPEVFPQRRQLTGTILQNDWRKLHRLFAQDRATNEGISMVLLNHQFRVREARRAEANREELIERIAWAIRDDGTVEPLRGLRLYRQSAPTERLHGVSIPSFCAIAQGSKEVYLGEDCFRYDEARYLLATVALPVVGQVVEASPERPYLGLRLELRSGSGRLGHGRGRSPAVTRAGQREGRRREPPGCRPARCRGAACQARRLAGRGADAHAARHARGHLPPPGGRAGRPAPTSDRPWAAPPPASPGPSSGSVGTMTSHSASRASRVTSV